MKERLENVLRPESTDQEPVLLLRGGVHEDGLTHLRRQAAQLDRRFTYQGGPCFGVSVFAATSATEARVLATRMDARRRYYRIAYRDLTDLLVLPTFRSPHWTVMFHGPDGNDYQHFMDSWGPLRDNPHYSREPEGGLDVRDRRLRRRR